MVAIRRVFKVCSLEPDGTPYPPETSFPEGFHLGQVGRPTSIEASDEIGQTKQCLFRPFQYPDGIPGLDYHAFINTNFSDWTSRRPVHFFERKPFHRALNCAICQDSPNVLKAVMKIIMDINFFINSVHHEGGVFYSGVGVGESLHLVKPGAKLRMPRFLSTTTELKFAKSRLTDKIGPALLVVRVPHGFWGARDISAFSSCPEENETMFCAYALFLVERVSVIKMQGQDVSRIDLLALDKYEGIQYPDDAYPPFHHAPIDIDELGAYDSYVRQYSWVDRVSVSWHSFFNLKFVPAVLLQPKPSQKRLCFVCALFSWAQSFPKAWHNLLPLIQASTIKVQTQIANKDWYHHWICRQASSLDSCISSVGR